MQRLENITQAYSQAPWRKQLQFIGLFLLGLVFIGLVAGIYLDVSARAAANGREIQAIQAEIETLDRNIEDLRSQLAFIKSSGEMEKRSRDLGFEPIRAEEIVYLQVSGYTGHQAAVLAPYSDRELSSVYQMPPEYTETLFEWLMRQFAQTSLFSGEVFP